MGEKEKNLSVSEEVTFYTDKRRLEKFAFVDTPRLPQERYP
jgi:hypothetical protein